MCPISVTSLATRQYNRLPLTPGSAKALSLSESISLEQRLDGLSKPPRPLFEVSPRQRQQTGLPAVRWRLSILVFMRCYAQISARWIRKGLIPAPLELEI